MGAKVIRVRNVNEALYRLRKFTKESGWIRVAPRGMETMEWPGPVITEYTQPTERVLFDSARDCNPFFHLFEALWILDGRSDVAFLADFLPRMSEFSDNGTTFHAPYGQRLRYHFTADGNTRVVDQLTDGIEMLLGDVDTRRLVMAIWDPRVDLGKQSKDIPCNDLLMFKARDGYLHLTVACRSNDAILGAYGTNAVQFSIIQEFVARAAGLRVGEYRQLSDSFHIYTDNEAWKRVVLQPENQYEDPYESDSVWPAPLISEGTGYKSWLAQNHALLNGAHADMIDDRFLRGIALPLLNAWELWKKAKPTKDRGAVHAIVDYIQENVVYCDWRSACSRWLYRRTIPWPKA